MGRRPSILTVTLATLAWIAVSVWLSYLQRYGIFTTGREAEKICGEMNVAVQTHSDEEPTRKWITATNRNADTAELEKLRQDFRKSISAWWICDSNH